MASLKKIKISIFDAAINKFVEEMLIKYMAALSNSMVVQKNVINIHDAEFVSRGFTQAELEGYEKKMRPIFQRFFEDITPIISDDMRKHNAMFEKFEQKKKHVHNVLLAIVGSGSNLRTLFKPLCSALKSGATTVNISVQVRNKTN
jgi:CTP synthase (UTP-ammonia lyase)